MKKNIRNVSLFAMLLVMLQSVSALASCQIVINSNATSEYTVASKALPVQQAAVMKKSWFNQPMTTIENDDLEASPYGPIMMQGLSNKADMSAKLAAAGLGVASVYGPVVASAYAPAIAANANRTKLMVADAVSAARETGRAGGSFSAMGRSAGSSYGGAVNGYSGAMDSSVRFANVGSKLDKVALYVTPALKSAKQGIVQSVRYGTAMGTGWGVAVGGIYGTSAAQPDDNVIISCLKGAAVGGVAGGVVGSLAGVSLALPYQAGAGVAQVLGATGRGQALAGMGTLVAAANYPLVTIKVVKNEAAQ